MSDYVFRLFSSQEWVPRSHCGLWTPDLMWMHLVSDFLIWASYMAIPTALVYFTFRRRDIPFHWMFWLFGWFIVSCGFTHFVELFAFTSPMYRLAGVLKALTAVASVATVVALIRVTPRILATPGLGEILAGLDRETLERRRAEARIVELNRDLKQRADELQTLLDLTPVAIAFARDRECRDIAMNRACAELLGLPPGANASKSGPSAEGLPFRVLKDGVELAPDELPMQRAAATGRPVTDLTVQLERRDGRTYHLLENAAPLFDEKGAVRGCVGAFVDITRRVEEEERRRALEARLLETQRRESLGALAGGVAHDFNNLLVGVLGNAELARDALPQGSPAIPLLERIMRSAQAAANLTRQMLAYSGKGRFLVERLDLSSLVSDMIALLEASISKKAVLRCEFEPGLPAIEADRGQISQVVMNLLVNASEAIGDRPGTITLRTRRVDLTPEELRTLSAEPECRPGPFIVLEVKDDGCGIPADARDRIFEPFYSTKFAGRGLGLAAVQGIVRSHGGAVRVESAPGEGAAFSVYFPVAGQLARPADNPVAGQDPPERLGRQGRAVVLVADDEQIVRDLVRQMLEVSGYTVIVVNDGVAAVEAVRHRDGEIDVAVLDLTMPRMSGDEAMREIHRFAPDLPVILTSGYTEQDAVHRFQDGGRVGFIQKPFGRDALLAKLGAALQRTRPGDPPP